MMTLFLLIFIYIHSITVQYSTFILRHLPRFFSISSLLWSAHWEKFPGGAEPRIEIGQADTLPADLCRTLLSYAVSCAIILRDCHKFIDKKGPRRLGGKNS
jgi:hypothetical protein